MNPFRTSAFIAAALLAQMGPQAAAETLPATVMTERGQQLVKEDFAGPLKLAPKAAKPNQPWTHGWTGWKANTGKWESANGVLQGTELAENHHPAHAAYGVPFQNAVIQYDMRLEGCRMARWRATDDKDYVCSVRMTPDGVGLYKDEWHTIVVEIRGDEIVASFDGQKMMGRHPNIAAKKQALRFGIAKGTASICNLRVWEATPNPDWAKNRAALAQ